MTDIIAEIEKAIDEYAHDKIEAAGIKAGTQFILPLLKKAIEDRDNYIRLCEHFERPHEKDSEIRVCNNEILELLGEKHE